jgi:alkylation response protein AidB-like acyl-CoA dehydrogenase
LPPETDQHREAKAFAQSIPSLTVSENRREWFRDVWGRVAAFGLLKLLIPQDRLDAKTVLSTLEGFGEGCRNGGIMLAIGAHCFGVGAPLARFGHEDHKKLLFPLRDGSLIAAFAATEPEAGSDVMSLTTRFKLEGDHYVLQGEKCFITNVEDADLFLVLATKDPRMHFRGVSAFVVPRETEGVVVGVDEARLGLHGCSVGCLTLDHARVPRSALVGRLGNGAAIFGHAMLWERSLIVAAQVGTMRRQLLSCLAQAKSRRQFGRPIGSNQYVAGRVVDILSRYLISRLLVTETVMKLSANTLTQAESSLAKMYVSESEVSSSLDAFRTYGGSGFMDGSAVALDLCNSLGGIIYSGTSDLQKVIIASELGLID